MAVSFSPLLPNVSLFHKVLILSNLIACTRFTTYSLITAHMRIAQILIGYMVRGRNGVTMKTNTAGYGTVKLILKSSRRSQTIGSTWMRNIPTANRRTTPQS